MKTDAIQSSAKLVALLCLVQIGTSLDNMSLTNALGVIAVDLEASIAQLNVTNVIYPLVAGAAMLAFGAVGLFTGWTRLLQLGLILLIAGEILAMISPNVGVLTYVARVLAGLGAGAAIPAVIALMTVLFTGTARAKAFGALGASAGLAAVVAPILSGLVIETLGWRWVFFLLTIPFAVALIGSRLIREPKVKKLESGFDSFGAILLISSIVLILFGLMNLATWGAFKSLDAPFTLFGYSPAPLLIVAGILLAQRALAYETQREISGKPVIVPGAFLTPASLSSLGLTGAYFGINGALGFILIVYLQVFLGYSAITSGLVIASFAIASVSGSMFVPGYIAKGRDIRRFASLSMAATVAVQVIMLATVQADYHLLWIASILPLGFLLGLFLGLAPTVVASVVPKEMSAQSSGIQGTARNVAQAVGASIAGVTMSYTMTFIAKAQADHTEKLSAHTQDIIQALPSVPVLSHPQLVDAAIAASIPMAELASLEAVNHAALKDALTGVILALVILTCLFWLTLGQLPRSLSSSPAPSAGAKRNEGDS